MMRLLDLIAGYYDSYDNKVMDITRDDVGHVTLVSFIPPVAEGDPYTVEYTYDPVDSLDGNLVEISKRIDEDDYAVTSYEYGENNELCNPTKITDPMGNETDITYNGNNQITQITTEAGTYTGSETKTMMFSYNQNNGNLASIADFNGNATAFSYNGNGFASLVSSYEGDRSTGTLINNKTISYNALNKQTGTSDSVTS